jgi:hypothetical protein
MYRIENKPDLVSVLSTLAVTLQEQSPLVSEFLLDPGGHRIVEFADWATMDNASDRWQRLYSETIRPLKRRDFRFIFHLGDVTGKQVFAVDEALDIIGDYSSCGHVTLILDAHEAGILWCMLNGRDPRADLAGRGSATTGKERYRFLFNTMNIDSLIILQGGRAMYFSREGQFALSSPSPSGILTIINARTRFSIGYQLGLLLRQDHPCNVALGLAASGVHWQQDCDPVPLIEYIRNWLKHL